MIRFDFRVGVERGDDRPIPVADAQFGRDLLEDPTEAGPRLDEGNAVPQPAMGKIHHIVDQSGHSRDGAVDHRDDLGPSGGLRFLAEQGHACPNAGKRVAQIMAEHGDELLSQRRCLSLVQQFFGADGVGIARFDMMADHLGEQGEHIDDVGFADFSGDGIDRAQRSEERAVGKDDGHRDVALQPVDGGRVMIPIFGIFGNIVDGDGRSVLPDFMADRRFDFQLTARLQTETDFVLDGTADPPVFGHASDGGKTHAGRAAEDFEDRGDGLDLLDQENIVGKVGHAQY